MVLLQEMSDFYPQLSATTVFIYLLLAIVFIVAEWKIFEKAGKPGWAILIPIYRIIVFLDIIEKPWWWLLLFLIPGVNIIFGIWATNLLSIKFGKGVGFTVGLLLLSPIFILILGFGDAKYQNTIEE